MVVVGIGWYGTRYRSGVKWSMVYVAAVVALDVELTAGFVAVAVDFHC